MKLKLPYLFLVTVFLLTGCTSDLDLKGGKISTQDLDKLIQQLEQGELYWDASGKAMSPFTLSMIGKISYQKNAATILGRLAEKGTDVKMAVPALIRILKYTESEIVPDYGVIPLRASSAHALGEIGDERAIDGLLELIRDNKQCLSTKPAPHCESVNESSNGSFGRYIEAVIALGKIGISRSDVITVLTQGQRDKDGTIRKESIIALSKIKKKNQNKSSGDRALGCQWKFAAIKRKSIFSSGLHNRDKSINTIFYRQGRHQQ
jgi:HEAT repeat protein